jgi:hypothetical protein
MPIAAVSLLHSYEAGAAPVGGHCARKTYSLSISCYVYYFFFIGLHSPELPCPGLVGFANATHLQPLPHLLFPGGLPGWPGLQNFFLH